MNNKLSKSAFACAFFLAFVLAPLMASAEFVKSIQIEGVQRVEVETVRSYLGVEAGQQVDRAKLNEALKKLYATELFADVKIAIEGDVLKVRVVENPVVNRVAFEGNNKVNKDDLTKEVQLKPRAVFSRTRVQQDVERVITLYQRAGRYKAKVTPKVIQQSQNRVDVVFEIEEGPITKIKDIFFVGNRTYSASQLRDVVRTEISRWYKFLATDDTYDPDRLDYDRDLLRRYYMQHGFADVQIKNAVAELAPEGDGFYITYTLEEGEKYKFGTVAFDVKLPEVKAEDLAPTAKTIKGEVYNVQQIDDSVDALIKALGDKGYAFVEVDPKADKDPANRTINITYRANEAPRVYVERINITGNLRTIDEVIRRELRLGEGDPFSTTKLKRSEQRIRNLGYFDKVNVVTAPGSSADRADITVEVSEKSTGELSLGAGFSTTDGPLADIGLKENNLLGRGVQVGTHLMASQRRQEITFSYTEPYFLNREIAAGFDIFKSQQNLLRESSYDSQTTGATLRAGYALTEHLTHTLNYTLREDKVTNVDGFASRYITEQQGSFITSSIGHALAYDTRDNRFDPTEGTLIRLRQDVAGLGGDTRYLRNELKAGYYYSLFPQWVLNLEANGGYIMGIAGQNVRINDRFFIGSRQVRGFSNAGLGPRDTATRDALGGNIYYAGTTELNFPLGLPSDYAIKGALFMDVGSVWESDSTGPTVVDQNAPRVSAGVGFAWASPFGPIRLDFGYAIVKESYDERELIRFTFGTRF